MYSTSLRTLKNILILLCLVIPINKLFADDVIKYNYYSRDYFGHIELDNIDFPDTDISESVYEAVASDGNIKKITGFYNGTEIVKFIDVFEHGKILSIYYFSLDGNTIFSKQFSYDRDFLKEIITQSNDGRNIVTSEEIFAAENADGIKYIGKHEWSKDETKVSMITEGLLGTDYNPQKLKSQITIYENNNKKNLTVKHYYKYLADGRLLSYEAKTGFFNKVLEAVYIEYNNNGSLNSIITKKGSGDMTFQEIYDGDSYEKITKIKSSGLESHYNYSVVIDEKQLSYETMVTESSPDAIYEVLFTLDEMVRYIDGYNTDYDLCYKVLRIELIFQPFFSIFPDTTSIEYESEKIEK